MNRRTFWISWGASFAVACSLSAQTAPNAPQGRPWYKIDEARRYVETPQMIWQWTDPRMADYPIPKESGNYGISGVTKMVIKATGHDQLFNPKSLSGNSGVAKIGLSKSYASDNAYVAWIDVFKTLATNDEYVEVEVHRSTANNPPHLDWNILSVRYYRDYPILQIHADQNQGGTWNFGFRPGQGTSQGDANFFIHGAPGIMRNDWTKAKEAAKSEMLSALLPRFGTTLEACVYKGYYIMGVYNVRSNEGVGFMMSLADYTVVNKFHPEGYKDIKFWLGETAGTGWFARTGTTQWYYAVTKGPAEIDYIGKMIVDNGGVPPRRAGPGRAGESK